MKEEVKGQKAEGIPLGEWTNDEIDRSGPSGNGNFTYVDISSIDRVLKQIVEPKEFPVEKAPSRAKQILREGDVVVSMTRPNLNAVALVPPHLDGSIGSTGFHVLRPKHADSGFLFYAVQTRKFIEEMSMKVQGALYPAVRPNDISAFCLPPFALGYQRKLVARIEELFSELDVGEENLRRARRQLGVYRQSLLKQAFEGKLTEQWRKQNAELLESPEQLLVRIQEERQARHEQQLKEWERAGGGSGKPKKPAAIKPFDTTELVGAPTLTHEWVILTYGELCSLIRNGISQKPSGTSGFKIARISAVRPMAFDMADYRFIECGDKLAADYTLNAGDLVFTRYNGARRFVGVCARFSGQESRLYPDKLIRTCPDLPSLNPRFLEIALNTGLSRAWLETKIRTTAGQSGVSGGDVKVMPVPLCSLPEQREIVRLLDEQFTVIEQNEREIDAALKRSEALRQSILKKAFTGQLVPQDPADEPASALVERIRKERVTHSTPKKNAKKSAAGRGPRKG